MPSPSLSDLGLTPDEEFELERERRRQRRHEEYADESGLRPLPTDDAVRFEGVDDEVVLPGVRSRAGLFGIGVGVGVAALAVAGGLYFGGYLDRPTLNPSSEPLTLSSESSRFDEWINVEALAMARVANRNLSMAPVPTLTEIESPDIRVLEEDVRAPHPVPSNPMPAMPEPEGMGTPRGTAPRETAPILKDPEMPPPPSGTLPDSEPLPAPAQPTAPAETTPPQSNPY